MKLQYVATMLLSMVGCSRAVSTFEPARPPAIPLAVKSPYMSTWQFAGSDGGNGGYLAGQWPQFWQGQITGWTGIIRVDNTSYTWMGAPVGPSALVNQTDFTYTSTQSVFTMDVAGLVRMTITFLSPVTPTDYMRQSLVFSYLDVAVTSIDGANHVVELYTDVSAEWVSGDKGATAEWSFGTTPGANGDIAYHRIWRQEQLVLSEINQQAEWGYWYWATDSTSALSFQSGPDSTVRGNFISTGALPNLNDTNFRAINSSFPVYGFAVNLGTVGTTAVNTLFTLGLTQETAIQFDGATGNVTVPSLWTSYYSTELAALTFFHDDYAHAISTTGNFDTRVAQDSLAAGGQNYLTITSLSVRQAFGATQLVGTQQKMYFFVKEISSDGNTQTVDILFPMHPILMYSNPNLLKLALDPLFENQESGQYPNMYSMHDLGSSYPNATGHSLGNDEMQPLEECGNMLIMTLAYALDGNTDYAYLNQHYNILNQWTQYLIEEALIPASQISTDDFAGSLANQTNLALKGIIGIGAMAVIANITGHTEDASNYTSISTSYINQWQNLGIAQTANPPHTTLSYGANDTHGLLYNLYGDAELGLGLVPQEVYDMQSAFYPTVELEFGVPLDTRHTYTKSDWEMFAAAIASNTTRDMFTSSLANWINQTPTQFPMSDLFNTTNGEYPQDPVINFIARPVVGGSFALLDIKNFQL